MQDIYYLLEREQAQRREILARAKQAKEEAEAKKKEYQKQKEKEQKEKEKKEGGVTTATAEGAEGTEGAEGEVGEPGTAQAPKPEEGPQEPPLLIIDEVCWCCIILLFLEHAISSVAPLPHPRISQNIQKKTHANALIYKSLFPVSPPDPSPNRRRNQRG